MGAKPKTISIKPNYKAIYERYSKELPHSMKRLLEEPTRRRFQDFLYLLTNSFMCATSIKKIQELRGLAADQLKALDEHNRAHDEDDPKEWARQLRVLAPKLADILGNGHGEVLSAYAHQLESLPDDE